MKFILCPSLLLLLLAVTVCPQQPASDPFAENLFPPELVMQHQEEIKLTDEQKNFLKLELRKAQTQFTELQWKLQDESEKLVALLKQPHIEEQQAVAQLDRILDAEREIKRLQVALVIRIKNALTPEQQRQLREIKGKK